MIDGITSTYNNSPRYATESNDALDKDAFLKLMIAQLQNQDILEPLDGTDYSAQLAQFSSLEQMQNMNDTLNMSLDANYLLTQSVNNTMTASMIGSDVKIAGDTLTYEGQDQVTIGYDLIAPAHELKVTIEDKNGVTVKTFDDLELEAGQYKLSWDFIDDNGANVAVGDYTVKIEAKTLGLKPMEVAQYFTGQIEAVRFSPDGTALVVNGVEYNLSDVFEVIGSGQVTTVEGNGESSSEDVNENETQPSQNSFIKPPNPYDKSRFV